MNVSFYPNTRTDFSSDSSTLILIFLYYYYFTFPIQIRAIWFASILSSCTVGWISIFGVKFKPWVVQLAPLNNFLATRSPNIPQFNNFKTEFSSYNTTFNSHNTLVHYDWNKKKKKSLYKELGLIIYLNLYQESGRV